MQQKSMMKRALVLLLALVLVVGLFPASALAAGLPVWPTSWTPETRVPVEYDTVTGAPIFRNDAERNLYELVTTFGQRLAATPNEYNAARYIVDELVAAGIPASDVEHLRVTGRPVSGFARLVFNGDLPDIYGTISPNTNAVNSRNASLVDFGAFPGLAVPASTTGDVIAVLRMSGSGNLSVANVADINAELDALQTANPGLNVVGVAIGRTGAVAGVGFANGVVTTAARPFMGVPIRFLDFAAQRAGSFHYMERYERTTDNAVIATVPAVTDTPDMIIVLSAHMDSVIASQGASDNGSGVVGLLELARRYSANTSNIEFRFLAIGSHEENRRSTGAQIMVDRLVNDGDAPIAIHLDMDMIASADHGRVGPNTINTLTMDVYRPGLTTSAGGDDNILIYNLPAYLVVGDALDVWSPGDVAIDSVRAFDFAFGDHQFFARAGIDAARMIMTCTCCNYLGVHYHRIGDNMEENYCYYRLMLAIELMANGVQRAIDQEITKRAHLALDTEAGVLALANAAQIFQTFDTVAGIINVDSVATPFLIQYPASSVALSSAEGATAYTFGEIIASGYGIIDHADPARNAMLPRFQTGLMAVEFHTVTFEAGTNGTVAEPAGVTVADGGQLLAAHIPAATANIGFSFAHWISSEHEGTFTRAELLALEITADTTFTAIFDRVQTGGGGGGFQPPDNGDGGDDNNQGEDNRFADVSEDNWFYEAVMFIYELGLMTGTSETGFAPNATLSRAMVATILHRLDGAEASIATHGFGDVAEGRWYTDAVAWAFENGIVQGVTDGSFAPNAPITREQFATMLFRYAEFAELDTEVSEDASLDNFGDAAQVGAWAAEAKLWANYNGLITGMTATTLYPQGTATRAQCATILMRFIQGFDILD